MKGVPRTKLSKIVRFNKYYYLMLVPGIIYFIIFHYFPMAGLVIAFKEYNFAGGIFGSRWAEPTILKWFNMVFTSSTFWQVLKNTIIISTLKLIFSFPAPILLALLINEIRRMGFKRTIQTVVYLPHFISWVVIGGIMISLLSSSSGIMNLFGVKRSILMDPSMFRGILVVSDIWKEAGWGTVIFLAAMAGIDPNLYEASTIDGANRFQKMFYITLPGIVNTIIILLILKTGRILNAGFDQIFILKSPMTEKVADIIDTYVYRVGLASMRFSLATAVGVFKSVVGLTLVIFSNWVAKRYSEQGGLW